FDLEPTSPPMALQVAVGAVTLNRPGEAKAALKNIKTRGLADRYSVFVRYAIAFLDGDASAMQRLIAEAGQDPIVETGLLKFQADTEAYFGHMQRARDLNRRSVEAASGFDPDRKALVIAFARIQRALHDAELGMPQQVRSTVQSALADSSAKDIRTLAALA